MFNYRYRKLPLWTCLTLSFFQAIIAGFMAFLMSHFFKNNVYMTAWWQFGLSVFIIQFVQRALEPRISNSISSTMRCLMRSVISTLAVVGGTLIIMFPVGWRDSIFLLKFGLGFFICYGAVLLFYEFRNKKYACS